MTGTFLCPQSCGFAKVGALEIVRSSSVLRETGESNTKYQARLKVHQYNQFKSYFPEGTGPENRFTISFKFHKKLPGLREKINKWNPRKADEKSKYLETFSLKKWQLLVQARKQEHSLANCKGCAVRYVDTQAYFPVKSPVLKGKAKSNPVFAAETQVQNLNRTPQIKPLQRDIKNIAKAIYDKVDSVFEKTFCTSFAQALSKVSELNLQHKTPNERRQDRRNYYRLSKENIEKQMEETAFLRWVIG